MLVVKLHDIEKVINHYEPDIQDLGDNLIDLEMEREKRKCLINIFIIF